MCCPPHPAWRRVGPILTVALACAAAAAGALLSREAHAWQPLEPAWMVPSYPAGCDGARGWGTYQWLIGVNSYTGPTIVEGGTLIMTPPGSSEIVLEGDGVLCVTDWQGRTQAQWSCPCPSGAETSQSECDADSLDHYCTTDPTTVACTLVAAGDCGEPAPVDWTPPAGTAIELTDPRAPMAGLVVHGTLTVPSGGTVDVYLPPEGPARGWPVLLIQADISGTWTAGTIPADTELHHDARGLWLRQTSP